MIQAQQMMKQIIEDNMKFDINDLLPSYDCVVTSHDLATVA